MFWTNNLSGGQVVNPCSDADASWPWQFDLDIAVETFGAAKVGGIMLDKKSRSVFMTAPDTRWHVYLAGEALDPKARPSKDNPVVKVTALVGDYDTPLIEKYVDNAGALKYPPSWIEQSLSGNFRAVWLFAKPLGVTGSDHARALLEKLGGHVKVKKLAPGWDKNSSNPAQCWTNGGRWLRVSDKTLPADLLTGLAIESLKGLRGDGLTDGVVTDIKAMAVALAEKYPRFANWPGEFALEGQGPSFWLGNSESPKSAIVKPWGMFTFADGAPKAAYSWSELVGREVADTIVAKKMSEAASEIYFDGMKYFIRTGPSTWSGYSADPIKRYLKIQHGLSGVAGPEGYSQLDEALHSAEQANRVTAVCPCIPYPPGIVEVQGKKFLNDWADLCVKPMAGEGGEFGDGFPHIAEHITHLLTHPELPQEPQPIRFLDWLSVFYRSVLTKEPQSGQALFLLGGTGVGKGLLSGIIQIMVGGGTRAEEFLTGRSAFGGECYDQPLMCVDDLAGLETRREVIKFTENLKARVANASGQSFHKKHQTPASIPWFGRIFVTMNDDDNSMSVMPDFSSSVEDKISLLHASPTMSGFASLFATFQEKQAIIRREASAFARYLLKHFDNIEPDRRDPRYGTKAYHFSTLRDEVADAQALGTLAEPLREYLTEFFIGNPAAPHWEGRASTLYREIQGSGLVGAGSAYPHTSVTKLGRQLRREAAQNRGKLYSKRYPNSRESAVWIIKREFLGDSNE
jgi:hypothetical protein